MKSVSLMFALVITTITSVAQPSVRYEQSSAAPAMQRDVNIPASGTGGNSTPRMEIQAEAPRAAAPMNSNIGAEGRASRGEMNEGAYAVRNREPGDMHSSYNGRENVRSGTTGGGYLPQHATTGARRSQVDGRYYYYCTSAYTRAKRDSAGKYIMWPNGEPPQDDPYSSHPRLRYAYLNGELKGYDMPERKAGRIITPAYFSFDGYTVYNKDTTYGIVTILNNTVLVERTRKQQTIYETEPSLKDRKLTDIVLFKGLKEFHMHRVGNNKKLWRVIHSGKLSVYDTRFRFVTVDNIDTKHLKISRNGVSATTVSSKEELITAINHTYHLNLKASKYTWEKLLAFLNKLD